MKSTLVHSLLAITCLAVGAVNAQTPPPAIGLSTSINVSLKVTETGNESSRGPAAKAIASTQLVSSRLNTKEFIRTLNDQHHLLPNTAGWSLVGVIHDAQEISSDYLFYLVKTGETPVLIPSDALSFTVDAAALAYREQSTDGILTSGGGKFRYAVTFAGGETTVHGTASGGYSVRSVTVGETTATLVIPSAITFRLAGAQENEDGAGIVEGTMVFTAHKPVDLSTYPLPEPEPEPEPEPVSEPVL